MRSLLLQSMVGQVISKPARKLVLEGLSGLKYDDIDDFDYLIALVRELYENLDEAEQEIKKVNAALREYGEHDWSCALGYISPPCGQKHKPDNDRCDCGLAEALSIGKLWGIK